MAKVSHGQRATIVDVARAARVSPATVSNAITGKKRVDKETRARIETAIKDLGYVPNTAARGMRTGRNHAIAIYSSVPTGVAAGASKLGFLMELAASAAVTAMERNTSLVLVPPISDASQVLNSVAIDGALLLEPLEDDPVLEAMQARGIPTVTIGAPVGQTCPHVDLDYSTMAALLFTHLVDQGARAFPLIVGQSRRGTNIIFERVYREQAMRIGMEPVVLRVDETDAESNALQCVSEMVAQGHRMDAVLVPIDAMATGVMRALKEAKLAVPDRVRVATRYDGVRARSEEPQLTALDLRLEEVAKVATRTLMDLTENISSTHRVPAPSPILIARGSTVGDQTESR